MQLERAILAGGCFWGMQELIRKQKGVIYTRVGYSGGDVENATYRNHGSHAEAVEILFNPENISYRDLLIFFFKIHDSTTLNRQGNDIGTSYRSEIFYTTQKQKESALELIKEIDNANILPDKIVTKVTATGAFWEAEKEHQDYLLHYPNGYTCHYIRQEWDLEKLKEKK